MKIIIKYIWVFLLSSGITVLSESPLDDFNLDEDFPLDETHPASDNYASTDPNLTDFDYIDDDINESSGDDLKSPNALKKETIIYKAMLEALKRPEMSQQLGQVLPILRSMSPPQRLTLAALLTAQVMASPKSASPTLDEVVAMFGVSPHDGEEKRKNMTSALLLPLSLDIANIFRGAAAKSPEALELRRLRVVSAPPRRRVMSPSGRPWIRPGVPFRPPPPSSHNRRNVQVQTEMVPPPPPPPSPRTGSSTPHRGGKPRRPPPSKQPTAPLRPPVPERKHQIIPLASEHLPSPNKDECDYFTNTLCLEVRNYPKDAIMASIHRNRAAYEALLADIKQQSLDVSPDVLTSHHETRYAPDHSVYTKTRRQDESNSLRDFGSEDGFLCPSTVKYARPKRARATSGDWKFIVNTGDYTQTLRLEMCLKPHDACSFISENFRSECSQVYNYHRLLTWDEAKGLHMDIFKVPTCCSCHVQGYSFNFPPRAPSVPHETSPRPENFPGVDFVEDHLNQPQQPKPNEGFQPNFVEDLNLRPPLLTNSGQFHENSFTESFNQDHASKGHFGSNQINNGGQFLGDQSGNQFQEQGSRQQFNFHEDRTRINQFQFHNDETRNQFQFQEDNSRKKFHTGTDLRVQNFQSPKRDVVQFPKIPDFHVTPPPSTFEVSSLFQRQGFRHPTSDDLKPPKGPPLPLAHETDFHTFAGNQLIRRSRNQTSHGLRDDVDLDVGETAVKRRPFPNVITSDVIRIPKTTAITTTTVATTMITTTTPQTTVSVSPTPVLTISAGGKRVNYNYHPIIDYFKTQQNRSFNQANTQEWKPIVGDAARHLKEDSR